MNRQERRASASKARAPKLPIAFATPFGVAYFDQRRPMDEVARGAAEALAAARPLRIEQRNRLRSALAAGELRA